MRAQLASERSELEAERAARKAAERKLKDAVRTHSAELAELTEGYAAGLASKEADVPQGFDEALQMGRVVQRLQVRPALSPRLRGHVLRD